MLIQKESQKYASDVSSNYIRKDNDPILPSFPDRNEGKDGNFPIYLMQNLKSHCSTTFPKITLYGKHLCVYTFFASLLDKILIPAVPNKTPAAKILNTPYHMVLQ